MEIRWGNEKRENKNKAVPDSVKEDAAETIVRERRFANVIDQIVSEHEKQGGFENLQGKGEPLHFEDELHENYYLNRIMKNANVLPPWLEMQHEIRDTLRSLVHKVNQNAVVDVESAIKNLNLKIRKYNRACPSPLFVKPLITLDNYQNQVSHWE